MIKETLFHSKGAIDGLFWLIVLSILRVIRLPIRHSLLRAAMQRSEEVLLRSDAHQCTIPLER